MDPSGTTVAGIIVTETATGLGEDVDVVLTIITSKGNLGRMVGKKEDLPMKG